MKQTKKEVTKEVAEKIKSLHDVCMKNKKGVVFDAKDVDALKAIVKDYCCKVRDYASIKCHALNFDFSIDRLDADFIKDTEARTGKSRRSVVVDMVIKMKKENKTSIHKVDFLKAIDEQADSQYKGTTKANIACISGTLRDLKLKGTFLLLNTDKTVYNLQK